MVEFVYCNDCEEVKDKLKRRDSSDNYNYCNNCGSEVEILDNVELSEKYREEIDWPIRKTFTAQAKIDRDVFLELLDHFDSEVLPFEGCEDYKKYHLEVFAGQIDVTVEFKKDGTYEVLD